MNCNKGYGSYLKQIEQAYGDRDDVVLIAIKTDGGGAKAYLKSRVDVSKWLIAEDANAVYYKKVMGLKNLSAMDSLYLYTVMDSKGVVTKSGDWLGNYNTSKVPPVVKARVIDAALPKEVTTFLPKENKYPDFLNAALLGVKVKDYSFAIQTCLGMKGEQKEAAQKLLTDLDKVFLKQVVEHGKKASDTENKSRILNYLELLKSSKIKLKGSSKEAQAYLTTLKKDKTLKIEISAHKDYVKLQEKIQKASDGGKPYTEKKLQTEYARFVKKYAETHYGSLVKKLLKN